MLTLYCIKNICRSPIADSTDDGERNVYEMLPMNDIDLAPSTDSEFPSRVLLESSD